MVKPSAHASHILVKSKGEATQLASNIKKFKDFQKTARKKSDCPSSQKGGDLGWVNEKVISQDLKSKIQDTLIGSISEPIFLKQGILFFQVRDKKIITQSDNLEIAKKKLVQIEKAKILRMFSLSHYDSIKRSTAIKYH